MSPVLLMAAGCATWGEPTLPATGTHDHLLFLAEALNAAPATREQLWQTAQTEDNTPAAALRRALLQTVPGHAGYQPAAARAALAQLTDDEPEDVALVARVRLHSLQAALECSDEVRMLRKRLAAVADIERQLDRTEP